MEDGSLNAECYTVANKVSPSCRLYDQRYIFFLFIFLFIFIFFAFGRQVMTVTALLLYNCLSNKLNPRHGLI